MQHQIKYTAPKWSDSKVTAAFSMVGEDPGELDRISKNASSGIKVLGPDMGINTQNSPEITENNRKNLLELFNLNSNNLAFARQVHGSEILTVDKPGIYNDADGLITSTKNLTIGVLVADCAAVMIKDSNAGIIGVFHAGWRGAVAGIVPKGLSIMQSLGAKNFDVWISPCIGVNAFEVGQEVAKQFPSEFVKSDGFVKPHVDLRGYIVHQVKNFGVKADRISSDDRCTFEDHRFYSYRRQKDASGRMMAIMCLNA